MSIASKQIRVAVVGTGAVARAVHLPIMTRRSDRFVIAGLSDLVADAVKHTAARFGISHEACFESTDEMLEATQPDALVILTSGSHATEILAGLRREIPVFTEKPLAYTRRQGADIAAALGGRPDQLMVGYMKLYDTAVQRAAELVADRERPRSVEVTVLHPPTRSQLDYSELDPYVVDTPADIVERLREADLVLETEALGPSAELLGDLYTGTLLGSIVHELAVLRSLGVELDSVDYAERWPRGTHPPSVAILGRTADCVRISVRWHYLSRYPSYREEVRWHDSEGSVELAFPAPYLLRAPTQLCVSSARDRGVETHEFSSHVESFEEELLAFHRMVTEGVPPLSGVEHGIADIAICQAIARTIAAGEGVTVSGEAAH